MNRRPSNWLAIPRGCQVCANGWPPTGAPCPCSTRRVSPARWRRPMAVGSTNAVSADELVHITRAQSHLFIMGAAEIDLGEDILIAQNGAIRIDIDHHAIDLEKG